MRILRVAPWLYPDTMGGGQYHVHAMSRDQAAMGHDVTIATIRADPSLPKQEETDKYAVRRFDALVSPLGNDISPGLARYLKNASEFDVIHAHSQNYFSTNLAALKRRIGSIPLAITNHGLYSQSAPEQVFRWYLGTLGRWTFSQADVVFCYTETEKERVRALGVDSRIEVVANGIDLERFRPDGPVHEAMENDGPVVLFVGRLVEGKRPTVAVEAFVEVLMSHPGAKLVMVGHGPLREEVERTVDAFGIDESVDLLGEVPYDAMPGVYRGGDVLILPARVEGVPRTVMEALVSSVPVVCSDLDQLRKQDLLGIRFVGSDLANDFGSAIEGALDTEEEGVRNEAIEAFDWSRTVEETTAALDRES